MTTFTPCSLHAALAALALALSGCAAADPALRKAISDVADRPESARVALRPYAEQGNEAAIAAICIAYGRSMDYQVRGAERVRAFEWCRQAALAGRVEAQYHLGMFYKSGIGITEDRALALHWYKLAASGGHDEAENEARGLEGKPRVCRNLITNCKLF